MSFSCLRHIDGCEKKQYSLEMNGNYALDDSIVALATPFGESAIAVIRLSGADCLERLDKVFKGAQRPSETPGYRLIYGLVMEPVTNEAIDQVLLAVYRGPRSYSGENSAEVFCHGSPAIIKRLLDLFTRVGFRDAGPGEFTLRAFSNGKIDLTRAEAVNEIIRSKTDKARSLALSRLSGSIEEAINKVKDQILDLRTAVEIRLDYPDEEIGGSTELDADLDSLSSQLKSLIDTYSTGKMYQEGAVVAIAGRTNAGKSTLFNLLLREDRAIVSDIHGTTRDFIEGLISVQGVPVRLFDTAGLRQTDNPIEQEGIKRTDRLIENAQALIYVIDASSGLEEEDRRHLEGFEKKIPLVCLWNKSDKSRTPPPEAFIPFSALEGKGVEALNQALAAILVKNSSTESSSPVIDSLRQKNLLEKALLALSHLKKGISDEQPLDMLAVDIKDALDALGEITGEITTSDLLEKMFSRFCVGK